MSKRLLRMGSTLAIVSAFAGIGLLLAADEKPTVPSPHYRAKQILGSKVLIEGDTAVGTVDDIVLDDNGNVDYLIVLNEDKKLVSVPWDAATFNVDKRSAYIPIDPDKYSQVPRYTVEQYPAFDTPRYRTQTYRYYGLTPGQERRLIRRGVIVK